MGTVLLIVALLIAIVAVVFAVQNTMAVTVTFFAWEFEQSLALVLLLTLGLGVLIGVLPILPGRIRGKWRLTSQKKKLDALEKKLQEETVRRAEAEKQLDLLKNPPAAAPEEPASPAGGSGTGTLQFK